ncbi:hypothetical protein J7S20_06175 [Sphingomonadaceae bacterium LXI357]|uniref:AB hydrolase-1 domain-containing protein n=1 Tax=Stakelama marina TaxID=2826939 RepID=A0A8T4IG86_9SPHN|nr:hypothetical protein [Stakelama marina]
MIVVLHGDAPDAASDSYHFARTASQKIPDSAVVTLLRPGYSDAEGNRSPGERGHMTGDALTPDRIRTVGDDIERLKTRYPQSDVILVGHSTSAAMAADLAGTRGGLIDGMVLVSCPCTLPEWRKYMAGRDPDGGYALPSNSLDPLQTAGGIASDMRAAILVGGRDETTPERFSRTYAEAIALRGIDTDYRVLPAQGHDIFNDADVLNATERLAASLPRKTP